MLYQAMVFLVFSNSMQRGVNIENTDKSTIPLNATNGILEYMFFSAQYAF